MSQFYRWQKDELLLSIKIQPSACRDEIAGVHGTQIKIRIKAPPVDGRANDRLISHLAKLFAVPRSRITIVSGEASRNKRVAICASTRLPEIIAKS